VTLTLTDGKLNVPFLTLRAARPVARSGFRLVKAATIVIGRGENKGRTVTYHNVVRRWIKLGDWSGKATPGAFRCRSSRVTASTKPPSWYRAARRKAQGHSWRHAGGDSLKQTISLKRTARTPEAKLASFGPRDAHQMKRAGCEPARSVWLKPYAEL
jgi:hypothetical protein